MCYDRMNVKELCEQEAGIATNPTSPPPVYILSGGAGASGEQLVHTVLAQFPEARVPVITIGNVRQVEQVARVVEQASSTGGTIAYTLVDRELNRQLVEMAGAAGVAAIDLMGPILSHLANVLGQEPLGQPGLYRQLHRDYFDRVAAIEYTMAHDDGKDPSAWDRAEIMLVGVSRTGKTPISLYLSVLGWKVANLPLVPGVPPPEALFKLDSRRVIGLTIEPGQLLLHRQQRQRRLGATSDSPYVDPETVFEETQDARRLFRKNGFSIVDVTDKPIESIADEIIRLISRFSKTPHRSDIP